MPSSWSTGRLSDMLLKAAFGTQLLQGELHHGPISEKGMDIAGTSEMGVSDGCRCIRDWRDVFVCQRNELQVMLYETMWFLARGLCFVKWVRAGQILGHLGSFNPQRFVFLSHSSTKWLSNSKTAVGQSCSSGVYCGLTIHRKHPSKDVLWYSSSPQLDGSLLILLLLWLQYCLHFHVNSIGCN